MNYSWILPGYAIEPHSHPVVSISTILCSWLALREAKSLDALRAVLSQAMDVAFPIRVHEMVMLGRYPHVSGRPAPADGHRFLFLDEPLTYLDISHQLSFLRQLRTLLGAKDLCVVGVVHDLNLAVRHADALVVLADGKVVAQGAPEACLTPALLHQAFGVQAEALRTADGRMHLVFG